MTAADSVLLSVDKVSKKYCRSLRRAMLYLGVDLSKEIIGLNPERSELRDKEFFVLKDVSFELHRGQCVGVIGHNGSGKSTLLKLLSGIQRPDIGTIRVRGRVGALVELGAGFHPLLNGYENILLLASLHGMAADEIREKIDWIVHFSGLDEFLEMPVRNYSSGMLAKLAFSVVVSSDPDILLVDEVLSVGDLGFQARCLGRVASLMQSGTGVIFVSHQMSLVDKISDRVMLLRAGQPPELGASGAMIESYRRTMMEVDRSDEYVDHEYLGISQVDILPVKGVAIKPGKGIIIEARYKCIEALSGFVSFAIHRGYGEQIAACRTDRDGTGLIHFRQGSGKFRLHVDPLPLAPGNYSLSVRVYSESAFEVLVNHQARWGFLVSGGADVEAIMELSHRWEFDHES